MERHRNNDQSLLSMIEGAIDQVHTGIPAILLT